MKLPIWLAPLFDPFIAALLATLVVASLMPAQGIWAHYVSVAADIGIVLLFFLHGAKLSREAILAGAKNWRLHLLVLAITFLVFPLLGLAIGFLPGISPIIATGMMFLTVLPSTVQSSIAFTSIARGNVPAAICSAAFSNLAGIFITPLLVALLMGATGGHSGLSASSVLTIAFQLLLPFLLGHFLRPWIGQWVAARKAMLSYVDRGSILLVVYSAFGAAVIEGLWHKLPAEQLGVMAALCCVLLALILLLTWVAAKLLHFDRADQIVIQFCGSKKSLATGVPMAGVLFPAAIVGPIILPLMLFHQIQLIVCAILARHYAERSTP